MAAYGAFLERNAHIVDRVPSILERHTDAAHVCGHVPLTPVARQMKREICHVHGTSDYSLHVTLAPADCISHWLLRLICKANKGRQTRHRVRLGPAIHARWFECLQECHLWAGFYDSNGVCLDLCAEG